MERIWRPLKACICFKTMKNNRTFSSRKTAETHQSSLQLSSKRTLVLWVSAGITVSETSQQVHLYFPLLTFPLRCSYPVLALLLVSFGLTVCHPNLIVSFLTLTLHCPAVLQRALSHWPASSPETIKLLF